MPTPFAITFRNPSGREQVWVRFASDVEHATAGVVAALCVEHPNGRGGTNCPITLAEPTTLAAIGAVLAAHRND